MNLTQCIEFVWKLTFDQLSLLLAFVIMLALYAFIYFCIYYFDNDEMGDTEIDKLMNEYFVLRNEKYFYTFLYFYYI